MTEVNEKNNDAGEREVTVSKVLDAPRELVYKAWTQAEHLARWWSPEGFTNTVEKMEVKPGGECKFTTHGPDGREYSNHIIFKEVQEPERLVYLHRAGANEDNPPVKVTITFEEKGGLTFLTMTSLFKTAALPLLPENEYIEAYHGKQSLARVEAYLSVCLSIKARLVY